MRKSPVSSLLETLIYEGLSKKKVLTHNFEVFAAPLGVIPKVGQETRNTMVLQKNLESVFSIFKNVFLFPKPLKNRFFMVLEIKMIF